MKKIISFIINDLKEDFKTIKELVRGEYKSKYTIKQLIKIDFGKMLKNYWLFFIIIILAFLMGNLYSAWHYQDKCNEYIIENNLVIATYDYYETGKDWPNITIKKVSVENSSDNVSTLQQK